MIYKNNPQCPQCQNLVEIWTTKKDNTYVGGICRNCLINVDVTLTSMTREEIEECARD